MCLIPSLSLLCVLFFLHLIAKTIKFYNSAEKSSLISSQKNNKKKNTKFDDSEQLIEFKYTHISLCILELSIENVEMKEP